MENLSTAKILKYDSMLEELTLMSFPSFILSDDQLYYFQSSSNRLGQLRNLYLKLEPISWHYQSHEGKKWAIETLYNQPKTLPKSLAFIRFTFRASYSPNVIKWKLVKRTMYRAYYLYWYSSPQIVRFTIIISFSMT